MISLQKKIINPSCTIDDIDSNYPQNQLKRYSNNTETFQNFIQRRYMLKTKGNNTIVVKENFSIIHYDENTSDEIQKKMRNNKNYAQFIECIMKTCKSNNLKEIGIKDYFLREQRDLENPKWEKIILNITFLEKDLEKNIESWEKIRQIIDRSLAEMKRNVENKDYTLELEENFYINAVF